VKGIAEQKKALAKTQTVNNLNLRSQLKPKGTGREHRKMRMEHQGINLLGQ